MITCMYRFAYMISFLVLACMCVFGSLAVIGMGFSKCGSGFIIGLPFLDSHGMMVFSYLVELDYQMVLKQSGVVSRKAITPRNL